MNIDRSGGFVRQLLFLLAAPLVWFAHFSLVYGAASFGVALGSAAATIQFFIWGATVVAVAAIIIVLLKAGIGATSHDQRARQPMHVMTRSLAALSLVAVLLSSLALLIVPYDEGRSEPRGAGPPALESRS